MPSTPRSLAPAAIALGLTFALSACGGAGTSPRASAAPSTAASTAAPDASGWRLTQGQMEEIANAKKLPHRIFYGRPSTGPDAAWLDAVKRGDTATVKRLLDAGQNIEAKDEASQGQTALGWAAFIGYEDMFDLLVARGANLRATDRGDVFNVFKSAVLGNSVALVKKSRALLKDDIQINDQKSDREGETFVMVAASNNRMDTVKYFIAEGADLNLVSKVKDQSALSFACDNGYPDMQKLLIAHGAINHRSGKPSC